MTWEKTWRILNFAIFLVAHIGPMGTFFGDILYGSDVVRVTVTLLVDIVRGDYGALSFGLLWFLGYGFWWVFLSIYFIGNLILSINPDFRSKKKLIFLPLIVGSVLFYSFVYIFMFMDNFNRYFLPSISWGLWVMALFVGSAIILELLIYLRERQLLPR